MISNFDYTKFSEVETASKYTLMSVEDLLAAAESHIANFRKTNKDFKKLFSILDRTAKDHSIIDALFSNKKF